MTQSELKQLITYDPKTGIIKWKTTGKGRTQKPANVSDGCIDKRKGYLRINVKGKLYIAHRLIWLYVTGNFPEGDIDHINGVRHDNRFKNLREVTRQQNGFNRKARGYDLTPSGNYRARIGVGGKYILLGTHKTEAEAKKAYIEAKKKYHGKEFSRRASQ